MDRNTHDNIEEMNKGFMSKVKSWLFNAYVLFGLGVLLVVFGAIQVFGLVGSGNGNAVLSINPDTVANSLKAGDFLDIKLNLNTGGDTVTAVGAYINFDPTVFDISCNTGGCADVFVNNRFEQVAELRRTGGQIRIVAGTASPVVGESITVATLSFRVRNNVQVSETNIEIDNESSVIKADGYGTDILQSVQSGVYSITTQASGSLRLWNVEYNVDFSNYANGAVCPTDITWKTNISSDSEVYIGSSRQEVNDCLINNNCGGLENYKDNNLVLDHKIENIQLLCDSRYYFFAKSTSGALSDTSDIEFLSTQTVPDKVVRFEILNETAEPGVKSVVIRWSTTKLADSMIEINGRTETNSILTYTHSLRMTGLNPNTEYVATIRSASGSESDSKTITFTTLPEDVTLDSNIVVRAERDRVCDSWLSCASQVSVSDKSGNTQSACFDLALCDRIDPQTGECLNFVKSLTREEQFSIYKGNPQASTIDDIAYLTGNVKVGAIWQGDGGDFVSGVVEGYYPFSSMRQTGSSLSVPNGNFESKLTFPWTARFYDPDNTDNKVSNIENIADNSDLRVSLNRVLKVKPVDSGKSVAGVKVSLGDRVKSGRQYYISFDVKFDDVNIKDMIVQFGYRNYEFFTPRSTDVIPVSTGWQTVVAGPFEPLESDFGDGGDVYLGFLIDTIKYKPPYQSFYLDNVSIQPVLNASSETRITKSCRGYATEDAPSCRYFDINSGKEYQGWEGYCIEKDPINDRRCLQWLPIDVVAGSQSVISQSARVGYGSIPEERIPLYYCLSARGNAPYIRENNIILGGYCERKGVVTKSIVTTIGFINSGLPGAFIAAKIFDSTQDKNNSAGIYVPGGGTVEKVSLTKDGFVKEDLNHVVIRLFFARDDESCTGKGDEHKLVLTPANGFSDSVKIVHNAQKNEITTIKVTRLDDGTYKVNAKATNGMAAGTIIKMYADYYLREWCTSIAQVVDPFGRNSAWVDRIRQDRLPKSVLDLGYTRDQDYLPFGAVVPPDPDYNPYEWDSAPDEPGRQPLYIEAINKNIAPQPPYQARGGSPYSVNPGQGSGKVCTEGLVGQACSVDSDCDFLPGSNPTIYNCVEDTTLCNGDPSCEIGYCDGGPYNNKICDLYNGYSDCNPTEVKGVCSYPPGVTYQIGTGVCVSGNRVGSSCTTNNQCGTDRKTGETGRCIGVNMPDGFDSEQEFLDVLNNGMSGEKRLSSLFAKSQSIWEWDIERDRYIKTDKNWDIAQFIDINNREPKGQCVSGPYKGVKECTSNADCTETRSGAACVESYQGFCADGDLVNTPCSCDPSEMVNGECVTPVCISETSTSPDNGICRVYNTDYTVKKCNALSGIDAGKRCASDTDCAVSPGVCKIDEYDENNTPRPPQVVNIELKSSLDTITEKGGTITMQSGRTVALSFNSIVDSNQLPLVRYTVDWGDGTVVEESDLKIPPKTEEPHILTHTYFCDNPNQDGICEYKVRIQIEDNWGWCSGDFKFDINGNIVPIDYGVDNYSGNAGCDSWDFVNGDIKICSNAGAKGCNKAPVANAGLDRTVEDTDLNGSEEVQLDGSKSYDLDGTIQSYIWRDENGQEIGRGKTITTNLSVGSHTITLEVADDFGVTSTDTVTIDIVQSPPVITIDSITPASNTGREPLDITVAYTTNQDCSLTAEATSPTNSYTSSQFAPSGSGSITISGLTEGVYTVSLICSNSNGIGRDDEYQYIVRGPVQAPQILKFTSKDINGVEKTAFLPGETVVFELTADDIESGDLEANVEFTTTDSTTRIIQRNVPEDFSYVYNTAGNYTVSATVRNVSTGKIAQTSTNITIARWWDSSYQYRKRITVTNNTGKAIPAGYPVQITGGVDTEKMRIDGTVRSDGNDLRIVYDTGTQYIELDRHLIDFNSPQTYVWFSTVNSIPVGGQDSGFWMYYSNPSAGPAPSDITKIMQPGVDANTVAVYYFEDGPGATQIQDSGSNGLSGEINNNPTWVSGKFGRSLMFDGVDDYVRIAHNAVLSLPEGTIEFWARHEPDATFDTSFQTYFAKDHFQTDDPGHIYTAKTDIDNLLQYRLQSTTNSYYLDSPSPNTIQPNQWYHIAVSWGQNGMKMYLDGVEIANNAYPGGIDGNIRDLILAANNYGIGKPGEGLAGFLNGRLDGFRISNVQRISFPYAGIKSDPQATLGLQDSVDNPTIALSAEKRVAGVSDIDEELVAIQTSKNSFLEKIKKAVEKILNIW